MDINKLIKITTVAFEDSSYSQFVKGLAFFKSILHKKMRLEISNPKILLLKGQNEFISKNITFMDSVLRTEADHSQIIVKKIVDSGANLVLVELGMSHQIINELAEHNITCLTQVSPKLLQFASRVSGGTVIDLMGNIPYNRGVLGTCKEFSVKPINGQQLVMLKVEGSRSYGATIIISGPDPQEMTRIKAMLRDALLVYRSSLLASSFFLQGNYDPGPNFSYMEKRLVEVQRTTIKEWKCSRASPVRVQLYSPEDVPLGSFILQTALKAYDPCESSDHLNHQHGVYFLHQTGLVQMFVTVTETRDADWKEDIYLVRACTKCGSISNGKVMLSNRSWEFSFYHFLSMFFIESPKARCGHSFFRDMKFVFSVRSAVIDFQFVAWPTFSMMARSVAVPDSHEILKTQLLQETLNAGETVLKEMIENVGYLTEYLQEEAGIEQDRKMELAQRLKDTTIELEAINENMQKSTLSSFKNYLEVETYRRSLLFSLSALNGEILNYQFNIKTSSPVKTNKRKLMVPPASGRRVSFSEISPTLETVPEQDESVRLSVLSYKSFRIPTVDFSNLLRGNVGLPLGHYNLCFPVDDQDPFSIISHAMQTQGYVNYLGSFLDPEDARPEDVDSELLYGSGTSHLVTFPESNTQADGNMINPRFKYKVKILFARQFHALRLTENQTHLDFLMSISRRWPGVATQLGKSGATFSYSHDQRYILKQIGRREMQMFKDIAPNYFRHMAKHVFHSMPSLLIKTLGSYRLSVKDEQSGVKTKGFFVLAVNLAANFPPDCKVYDLKGTQNTRRYVKPGDLRTKMDRNFIEEFQSLPLCLQTRDKQLLDAALWNDTLFLSKQNVIDYSLLVYIEENQNVIGAGIIDYMQHYTIEKAVESKYKQVINKELPTITDPRLYKTRFRDQIMFEYFIGVTN